MSKLVAIYNRVSTDEQGKGYSLETQLEGCREYAQKCDDIIVGEFADDYTGAKLDRPELDKLRELARSGAINKVITYELDRLARGMVKQILIEEEFAKWNVDVEYVLAEYEDNAEGRLQKNVRAVVAEYEREKIIERSIRGKRGRAKAGHVNPGRVAKYGFDYVPDPDGHKGSYVINSDEAKIVNLIYTWYVIGDESGRRLGMNKIAKRLSEMKIPTRYDGINTKGKRSAKTRSVGMWGESTIREILMSEIYAGTHYYNRLNPKRASGEPRVRDRSEWIAIQVPAIINRDIWETVQRLRDENKKRAIRNTQYSYLMRGRLRCAKCGHIMGCRTDNRTKVLRGEYICNRGKTHYYHDDLKTPICRGNVKSNIIDDAVWKEIKAILQSPDVVIDALQQEAHEHEDAITIIRDRLEIAEKQLDNLISQRERLLNLYLNGDFPKDLLDEKMAEIKQTIGKFDTEVASLQDQLNRSTPNPTDIDTIKKFCEQVRGGLEEFTFEDKQMIIELLNVTAIVMRDENGIRLALSGYFPQIMTDTFDPKTSLCSAVSDGVPPAIDPKTSLCFAALRVRPTSSACLARGVPYFQQTPNGTV